MKLNELVGGRLRELREARGMSQAELARRSGVAQSTLSRYERDDVSDPGINTLLSLARCLKVEVEDPADTTEATGVGQTPTPPPMGTSMVGREGAIETALLKAFDKAVHTFADVDAVRELLRASTVQVTAATQVRGLLDAAARLRERGQKVDPGAIALELTSQNQ